MREGRWKATALLFIAFEGAAVFWLYYALNLGNAIRGLASDGTVNGILGRALAAIAQVIPRPIANLSSEFVSSSGLEVPLRTLALRGAVLGSRAGVSSLGSAVVAPVYFATRRLMRRPRRMDRARKAKLLEPFGGPSTAVQESL